METKTPRILSVDAFRGFTVAAMLLVNNPGDWNAIYSPLKHADWNGCTFADLIFPFFLFISGMAIPLAFPLRTDAEHRVLLLKKVFRRSVILFALGLVLAFIPYIFQDPIQAFKTFRIPGILQRIALVYGVTAIIYLYLKPVYHPILFFAILLLYNLLLNRIPVPGIGIASLNPETNLGAWMDRWMFGEAHLWKFSHTWDPEGFLGTFPAIATALSGLLIGRRIKKKGKLSSRKLLQIFAVGIVGVIAGMLWDLSFPINKALWSSSYVLYTSGWAASIFALFYWLIDVKEEKNWAMPFVVLGSNALTTFFGSMLLAKALNNIKVQASGKLIDLKSYLYSFYMSDGNSTMLSSLLFALSILLFWWLIFGLIYSRKIIIKV